MTASRAVLFDIASPISPAQVKLRPFAAPARQPITYPDINPRCYLAKDLLLSCWNSAIEAKAGPLDLVTQRKGTMTAATQTTSVGRLGSVLAPTFASANSAWASIPLDLSAYRVISYSFWFWWDTYASDNHLLCEYTVITTAGKNGWNINPDNIASGNFAFNKATNGTAASDQLSFSRTALAPAGAWHFVSGGFDMNQQASAGGFPATCCDLLVPASSNVSTVLNANFSGPDTLYFFSRGGTSLFGDGRIAYFNIFRRKLTSGDEALLYSRPTALLRYPESAGYR